MNDVEALETFASEVKAALDKFKQGEYAFEPPSEHDYIQYAMSNVRDGALALASAAKFVKIKRRK